MADSYLLDIGWLFFGAWGVVVAVVTYKAVAPDLLAQRSLEGDAKFSNPTPNFGGVDRRET